VSLLLPSNDSVTAAGGGVCFAALCACCSSTTLSIAFSADNRESLELLHDISSVIIDSSSIRVTLVLVPATNNDLFI
jgi:hypothetical protein